MGDNDATFDLACGKYTAQFVLMTNSRAMRIVVQQARGVKLRGKKENSLRVIIKTGWGGRKWEAAGTQQVLKWFTCLVRLYILVNTIDISKTRHICVNAARLKFVDLICESTPDKRTRLFFLNNNCVYE